ncbi:Possible polyketide cyclase/dehydrase [Mycobacterium tuberculosis]|uniref:Possible polyketide cyclase/dehydrase n=6 Tax=Mycobacterium tuberculosis complex TaxID=77643 RepID=A0A0U0R1C9_MYCTX|nr:Possible polyketide cyclase/dehydrase [Mycobacterium tuberculosis]CFE49996.1 Possible polyketide cyclase/dehydrase [Mycobacterium tuberculosis]COV01272.1 Possible polyketide cyclase/dehydrase [Mycobacterium tuberculosis]COV61576.1 Possible polyketide cyclase/dehydrase [Mycobacterium tuberculosis]COW63674.1 Possible polyketide cyclase/dehydrase [Mycobacterium tuberculosis]
MYGPSGVSVYKHAPSRVRLRQTRSTVVKGRSGSLSWRRVRTGDLGLAVWGGREEYRAVKPGTPGIQPKGDMMTVTVVDAGPGRVSRSVEVAAPAAELFAIVADPRRHRELDGSGTVRGNIKVPAKLVVGSKFSTKMKLFGLPYRITSRVTALKPNELVEWSHPLGHRWRWEFESLSPTLTRVTETFDYHAAGAIKNGLKFYEMTGFAKSNAAGIEATLAKLSDQYARGRA